MFNGVYTVHSPTGEHRTFNVETWRTGERAISILAGPDNTSDYVTFGFVLSSKIALWKKMDKPFYRQCAKMLWDLAKNGENSAYAQKGVKLLLVKHCLRCNRVLTTPGSIQSGIGPECARKQRR